MTSPDITSQCAALRHLAGLLGQRGIDAVYVQDQLGGRTFAWVGLNATGPDVYDDSVWYLIAPGQADAFVWGHQFQYRVPVADLQAAATQIARQARRRARALQRQREARSR